MKHVILTAGLALAALHLPAQDSLTATVQDSLRKQKFIDRYENVFMTKVPTRHMFKLGLTTPRRPILRYADDGAHSGVPDLYLGYEYKVTPSISLGVSASGNVGWSPSVASSDRASKFAVQTDLNAAARWYYDMDRKIRQGLSAGNFSGNYLGVYYGQQRANVFGNKSRLQKVGVEYGFQRRFFNAGFLDFALGLNYRYGLNRNYTATDHQGSLMPQGISISTRSALGFALGDWKKKKDIDVCEILRCDDVVSSQLKLSWPVLDLGLQSQSFSGTMAYEYKFLPSLSVNLQVDGHFNREHLKESGNTVLQALFRELNPHTQLRYYFGQQRARRLGKGGYNLNGFYTGIRADYVTGRSKWLQDNFDYNRKWRYAGLGGLIGFQQTLFRYAYIDMSWSYSFQLSAGSGVYTSGRFSRTKIGFGFRF